MQSLPRPPLYRRRAKRWFARNEGLLIIIGALILFATFAIKDVLRDSAKGLAESINAAENLYLIRDDDLELHEELDEIDADVFKSRMDSLSAPLNSRKSDVRKSARSADFERNSQRLLRIENELD